MVRDVAPDPKAGASTILPERPEMQPGTPTKAAASPKITGRCGWGFLAFLHVGVSWGGCLDLHLRMDAACPVTVQVPLLENDMATAVKRAPAHTKAGLKQDRSGRAPLRAAHHC